MNPCLGCGEVLVATSLCDDCLEFYNDVWEPGEDDDPFGYEEWIPQRPVVNVMSKYL